MTMQHLIRIPPLGYLQADILILVRAGVAATSAQLMSWLRTTYPYVRRQAVANSLRWLIQRGLIERVDRGVYRPCA